MPTSSATALFAGACLSWAILTAASETVSDAHVSAFVARPSGEIVVELRYRIVNTGTSDRIPISWLRVAQTRLSDVRATWDDAPATMAWEPGQGRVRRGTVDVAYPQAGSAVTELALEYVVSQASDTEDNALSIHVPLIQVDLKPEESRADVFVAEIVIPHGMSLVESFPVGAAAMAAASEDVRYQITLPVVPSFLRLELREGDSVFTLPRVVDGVMVSLVVLLSLAAFVRLRRVQSR